jgi:Domain of unknown function (DUF4189)
MSKRFNFIIISLWIIAGATLAAPRAFAGWSSIAVDDKAGSSHWGSWGWAHNFAGKGEAIVAALNACSSLNCRYLFINEKKCIAYAESRAGGWWFGYAAGSHRASVKALAMSGCAGSAPAGTCRILLDNC